MPAVQRCRHPLTTHAHTHSSVCEYSQCSSVASTCPVFQSERRPTEPWAASSEFGRDYAGSSSVVSVLLVITRCRRLAAGCRPVPAGWAPPRRRTCGTSRGRGCREAVPPTSAATSPSPSRTTARSTRSRCCSKLPSIIR